MTANEETQFAVEATPVGPTDRPDDPLGAPARTADAVVAAPTAVPDNVRKPKPPTPDQEGCYYLG